MMCIRVPTLDAVFCWGSDCPSDSWENQGSKSKAGVRSGCPNRERPGHIGDFFRERRAELATQTIFEITASAPDQEEVYERRRARRREIASLSLRQRLAQETRFS